MGKLSVGQLEARPVTITIGGRERPLAPLTLGDLADFERYLREQRVRELAASTADWPPNDRQQAMLRLLDGVLPLESLLAAMGTLDGLRWLLRRSLQRADPETAADDLSISIGEMQQAVSQLLAVSGLLAGSGEPADPTSAAPTGQR